MEPTRTTQLDATADIIDLGIGQPSPSLLPLELIEKAAADRLQKSPDLLAYGYEQGDGHFRRTLAGFLSDAYGVGVHAGSLFITAGASQGLDLICTLFTKPGDTVLVEDPTYFLALRIFSDHRLNVVGVPIDENGLVLPALEDRLAHTKPAFIYTIPTFHNPGGCVLAADRRKKLVKISREHDLPVVADEVYHLLNYTATLPLPLACHADEAPILSLGSFSKILAPGLRLGWVQTGEHFMKRLTSCGLLDSGGGLNPFTSSLAGSAIELGLQQSHLTKLRTTYAKRLRTMCSTLKKVAGSRLIFTPPDGGFFVWAALPENINSTALLTAARVAGVGFLPGARCSPSGGRQNWIRLSFAYYDSETIETGCRLLGQII